MARRSAFTVVPTTRRAALSYDRSVPNGMGVTHLVEVNGRGAYEKHYERAARILGKSYRANCSCDKSSFTGPASFEAWRAAAKPAGSEPQQRSQYNDYVAWATRVKATGPVGTQITRQKFGKTFGARAAAATGSKKAAAPAAFTANGKHEGRPMKISKWRKNPDFDWDAAFGFAPKGGKKRGGKKKARPQYGPTRAHWEAENLRQLGLQKTRHLRARKAAATRSKRLPPIILHPAIKAAKKATKRRMFRQFRLLAAKIGSHNLATNVYAGRSGKLRHPPDWAIAGYRSARAAKLDSSAYAAKLEKLRAERQAFAQAIIDGRATRDPFAPNKKRNKRKTRKTRKGKKMAFTFMGKRVTRAAKKTIKRRVRAGSKLMGRIRKTTKVSRKGSAATRLRRLLAARTAVLRAAHTRFNSNKKGSKKKAYKRELAALKRQVASLVKGGKSRKRGKRTSKKSSRRTRKHGVRRWGGSVKGGGGHFMNLFGVEKYNSNRRRSHKRRSHGFRRNGAALGQIMSAFKLGGMAVVGFSIHRVLTNLLNTSVTEKFLGTTGVAAFSKLITGVLVAAAGIPLANKFVPGSSTLAVTTGMVVSVGQAAITSLLAAFGDTTLTGVLGSYLDAPGSASRFMGYGSYYTLPQGRAVYPSVPRSGAGGFGEYLQSTNTGLVQAPAGYGATPLLQAAAGYGEYEMVPGYSGMGYVDEGTMPNLAAAEQALNVAEAAAGFGDLSSVTTFNPAVQTVAVPDEPGGSRAGILAGSQGIFA